MRVEIEIPDNCEIIKEDNIFKIVEKKKESTKEEPTLPRSWEEFCELNPSGAGEYYISTNAGVSHTLDNYSRDRDHDKNLMSTPEEAVAVLALIQLRRLRETWIGSFEPNWNENDFYPAIIVDSYDDIIVNTVDAPRALLFPNLELAKEFRECFKDLLEEAKMLL